MIMLREITAVVIFIIGICLLFKLCIDPFHFPLLVIAIVCLLLAYFIWPSKKHGNRHEDNVYLDILEIAIELPLDILIKLFRILIRVFRKSDIVDIDL